LYPQFALVVIGETVARYYTEGYGHTEPFYYYFFAIGPTLFPWIFFLPLSLWIALSDRCKNIRKENVFLILWLFCNILFLSLSKAKRDFYLAPLAPAGALLTGSTWEALCTWAMEKLQYDAIVLQRLFFSAGAILTGLAFMVGNPFTLNFPSREFPHIPAFLLFAGLSFMTVALIKKVLAFVSVAKAVFVITVILVLAFQYLYLTYSVPIKNAYESGKYFYITVPGLIKSSDQLAYFGSYQNYALSFYAHRPVIYFLQQEPLKTYMASPEKRYLVIAESSVKYFQDFPWKVVFKGMYSEHKAWGGYVLLCNH
jgi:4-amino-4-deoxy-L-arabinose transferase-like glycosyltransferase